MLQPEDKESD